MASTVTTTHASVVMELKIFHKQKFHINLPNHFTQVQIKPALIAMEELF
jgi:hypothetical protein